MGEKVTVGPIDKGLHTEREPFVIDNDSFPVLINAYQWRGRVKRKRGTSLLGRLRRYFDSTSISYSSTATIALSSGAANLLTGFSLQTNGNIVPGSVIINNVTNPQQYTDPGLMGVLVGSLGGSGTINYASGAITIAGGGGDSINAKFLYYPDLPVLGLEDVNLDSSQFPGTLGFDNVYSYNISVTLPYSIYDVSFYKNPKALAPYDYAGYTRKTNTTPTSWNGQDYQQFWTTNYQGALWTTNGINVPFNPMNVGMQYKPIVTVTVTAGGPPATATLQIIGHGLVVGDFLFINEVVTTTGINFQTGYVIAVIDANKVSVEFPNATIATNGTLGIAQYLTNRSDVTKDCLRWYDGDPTDGNATTPTLSESFGWVNFAPPISHLPYSLDEVPEAQYYLVGARLIVPFKDRLLFFGPVIQTSVAGTQKYLQDTVIYSQNGTPFYTASFTGDVLSTATTFTPILTPLIGGTTNAVHSATPTSYFEDVTGYGGFITAGYAQPISTVSTNEDVLLVEFTNMHTRFVYSGNDIVPFNFFVVNSEYGTGSTFSVINLDRGNMVLGDRGIILSTQISSERVDLDMPDEVFKLNLTNNGAQRVTAQRDFINEWIYFSYSSNSGALKFPDQTFQYNYRDQSWAIFKESYTAYGQFRRATGYTWATIGMKYPTWADWNDPWNAGTSTLLQPEVIAGNQQGYMFFREDGTGEEQSLYIQNISGNVVTSPFHNLNNGDYIIIEGCIGTVSTDVNGKIFSVSNASTNMFTLVHVPALVVSGTYIGGGTITRMYVPQIQTKQFPVSWGMGRKTRIGPQMYLLTKTPLGQIEIQIFLSQNASSAYNAGNIVPENNVTNSGLIYTDILYTCPESTNLGLTPANTNLNMITGNQQAQIWHRMNTSLLGDTVQIGFTLSDTQMRDPNFNSQFAEIELHGFILDVSPSQVLS